MSKLNNAQLRILQHLALGKNRLSFSSWRGKYVWASEAAGPRLNSLSVERLKDLRFAKTDGLFGPVVITDAGCQFLAEQAGDDA